MNSIDTVVDSLEKSGVKPQFKRQLPDGTLIDADTSYLDLLNAKTRIANTAQSIYGASQEDKTLWAIEMKNFANMLYKHHKYAEAMEKYVQCLAAARFEDHQTLTSSSMISSEANNIDDMIVPVLCNMAACCLMMKEWSKVMKLCEEALILRPSCITATIRYCKALYNLGEYKIVLKKLHSLKTSSPTSSSSSSSMISSHDQHQIDTLYRQAYDGMKSEKKAEGRRKKALVKAFHHHRDDHNTSKQHIIADENSKDDDNVSESILVLIWRYIMAMISYIISLFHSLVFRISHRIDEKKLV